MADRSKIPMKITKTVPKLQDITFYIFMKTEKSKTHISTAAEQMPSITISEIITKAKETQLDVINQLRKYIAVEVIRI